MENKPKSRIEAAHIRVAAELIEMSANRPATAEALGLPREATALELVAELSQLLANITSPKAGNRPAGTLPIQI